MERKNTPHQCLSLDQIKAFLGNDLNQEDKVQYADHFSVCELCDEVKESFSAVNDLGVKEDITALKATVFDTINSRRSKTRRLFISRIAAGILLPITGIVSWLYWNNSAGDRLYNEYFQPYDILEMTTRSTDGISTYDKVTLPKDLELALDNYKAGNYKASLPHFLAYRKIQPTHTYANFLHALAQLMNQNLDTAIPILEEVRINDPKLYEDATWYLALAKIKKKDKHSAKQLLSELIQKNSRFYGLKAKALSDQL